MSNDYENLAKIILSSPQAGKIVTVIDQFNAIISSKEGVELLTMLAGDGGDAVKESAVAALQADTDKAKTMITTLLSSQEGTALAAKVIELLR